jgi:hypothetical protein
VKNPQIEGEERQDEEQKTEPREDLHCRLPYRPARGVHDLERPGPPLTGRSPGSSTPPPCPRDASTAPESPVCSSSVLVRQIEVVAVVGERHEPRGPMRRAGPPLKREGGKVRATGSDGRARLRSSDRGGSGGGPSSWDRKAVPDASEPETRVQDRS